MIAADAFGSGMRDREVKSVLTCTRSHTLLDTHTHTHTSGQFHSCDLNGSIKKAECESNFTFYTTVTQQCLLFRLKSASALGSFQRFLATRLQRQTQIERLRDDQPITYVDYSAILDRLLI